MLPEWTPRQDLSASEATRRAVQISLRALGTGTATHIRNHFVRGAYHDLAGVLKSLEYEGEIQRLWVADGKRVWPGVWYIHRDDLPLLARLEAGDWHPRTTLLSPFDNLICDRKRTELMWDFYFRLEIYTPKHKRQYGYFVLPVLYGDRLIGRVDPFMDRKNKRLHVHAVHYEPDVTQDRMTKAAVHESIEALAAWQNAQEIVMPQA